MRRLINAIRDFFYEATDYAIILTVVIAIAVILVWRFNVLFSFEVNKDPIQSEEPPPTTQQIPISTEDPDKTDPTNPSSGDYFEVTIVIPSGSSAQAIGDILVNNGLISDRNEFLVRVVEMQLDTKLKSGSFLIDSEMTLDEIITKISQ